MAERLNRRKHLYFAVLKTPGTKSINLAKAVGNMLLHTPAHNLEKRYPTLADDEVLEMILRQGPHLT